MFDLHKHEHAHYRGEEGIAERLEELDAKLGQILENQKDSAEREKRIMAQNDDLIAAAAAEHDASVAMVGLLNGLFAALQAANNTAPNPAVQAVIDQAKADKDLKVADRIANVEANEMGGRHAAMYLEESAEFYLAVAGASSILLKRLDEAYRNLRPGFPAE